MGKETLKSILHRLVITGLVSLALTGCVKARLEIGVKPDGSGTMSVAIGMTQEALSFAGEDGEGVMERLSEEMSGDEDTEEVEIRRWREGNYEWFSTSTSFETLEDLNSRLTDIKEFGSVSVTRERGLVRDRFVLDGEINPLMGDEEAPGDLLIDPGGFFEFQVVVGLPGEVVKTNGAFMEGSTRMLWTVGNHERLSIHAVSRAWNWTRIALFGAIMGLMGLAAVILVVGLLVFWRKKRGRKIESGVEQAGSNLSEGHEGGDRPAEQRGRSKRLSEQHKLMIAFGAGVVGLACVGVLAIWWGLSGGAGEFGALMRPGAPEATATAVPTDPPSPSRTPTETPAPSETPRPTETPTTEAATQTPAPTETPRPTDTQPPATDSTTSIGEVKVDHWVFEIEEVKSEPGMDSSRQNLVLLGQLTNEGRETSTFVAVYTLVLQDSQGRTYQEDVLAQFATMDKYGTEIPASISPEASRYVAIAFDVPASEETFSLVPGSLASSWSGDVTISLP